MQLIVPKASAGLRLDRFLALELPQYSRSRLQQLIRDGFVRPNGKTARPRDILRAGDVVDLTEPPPEKIDNQPEAIPLDILFEDDNLIVINKPAGLVVHPGAGHCKHTLVNALLHHFGHPVLGDKVYAPKLTGKIPRQMLHAWKLGFRHPRTAEWRTFEAPMPNDFAEALHSTGF